MLLGFTNDLGTLRNLGLPLSTSSLGSDQLLSLFAMKELERLVHRGCLYTSKLHLEIQYVPRHPAQTEPSVLRLLSSFV